MAASVVVIPQCTLLSFRSQVIVGCKYNHGKMCTRRKFLLSRVLAPERVSLCEQFVLYQSHKQKVGYSSELSIMAVLGEGTPDDDENGTDDNSSPNSSSNDIDAELFRDKMQRMLDSDDATFGGKDLATLIRKKYGRSYDVQLVKKEFLGRQLLAMNVMWKYREQRSFPLTEEEYLLHLDGVASALKGWGAVSYVQSTLAKTKERPRIGKAVSIFIDLDQSGGRANEWISK